MPEPIRFRQVTEIERLDHDLLEPGDSCYYLGEYIADGSSWTSGGWNQRVINLKIPVNASPERQYFKDRDIQFVANEFLKAAGRGLHHYTFVPIPPSEGRGNPLYDNRLVKILETIDSRLGVGSLDIRDMIVQTESLPKAHTGVRHPPEFYLSKWELDSGQMNPTPNNIIVFDDVLTRGAHFKATQQLMFQAFPGARVTGVFITRRVHPAVTWDDFDF